MVARASSASDTHQSKNQTELSDQTLLLLLLVSFLVAITGLLFAFQPTFTGFAVFNVSNANATAQANITIISSVAISVTGGWDFGEGFVNSTGAGAYGELQSGGCSTGCIIGTDDPYNYTNWTANINGSGQVTVRNSGSLNISVRADANQSPDLWFCNDEQHTLGASHLNNQSLNTTGGSAGDDCVRFFIPLTNYSNFNTTHGTPICLGGNLSSNEQIVVDMAIRVDARCPPTASNRYTTVTFFGYS